MKPDEIQAKANEQAIEAQRERIEEKGNSFVCEIAKIKARAIREAAAKTATGNNTCAVSALRSHADKVEKGEL